MCPIPGCNKHQARKHTRLQTFCAHEVQTISPGNVTYDRVVHVAKKGETAKKEKLHTSQVTIF